MKSTGWRAGEETDRTMWSRKISSHTIDHINQEKARGNEEEAKMFIFTEDGCLRCHILASMYSTATPEMS